MSLVLPLCEPQSTGLFGDVFCILKMANSENFKGFNLIGKAPSSINAEQIRSNGVIKIPETDVCSITLPGAIKCFETLHNKFGKLDLSEICKPAIKYAVEGITSFS